MHTAAVVVAFLKGGASAFQYVPESYFTFEDVLVALEF
jgi:hypothetical protein